MSPQTKNLVYLFEFFALWLGGIFFLLLSLAGLVFEAGACEFAGFTQRTANYFWPLLGGVVLGVISIWTEARNLGFSPSRYLARRANLGDAPARLWDAFRRRDSISASESRTAIQNFADYHARYMPWLMAISLVLLAGLISYGVIDRLGVTTFSCPGF